jgi:glutamate synthase (NADPH/NADH) small chain
MNDGASIGRKVAVIGTGSAGLACADILTKKGYQVNILNADMSQDKAIDGLFEEGYEAIFIDVGAEINTKMEDSPGADLSGVYDATDFLIRANVESVHQPQNTPLEIGRRVVVIGGDDTASECLRIALILGSEDVTCLCHGAENEIQKAREEGAKYRFLTQSVKFIAGANGRLAAVECIEMRLGEPDVQGRRMPVAVEGSNFSVAADTAIISKAATRAGVFISANYVTDSGIATVAQEDGKKAALAIDEYLQNKK